MSSARFVWFISRALIVAWVAFLIASAIDINQSTGLIFVKTNCRFEELKLKSLYFSYGEGAGEESYVFGNVFYTVGNIDYKRRFRVNGSLVSGADHDFLKAKINRGETSGSTRLLVLRGLPLRYWFTEAEPYFPALIGSFLLCMLIILLEAFVMVQLGRTKKLTI
jgi:hypothetical protein